MTTFTVRAAQPADAEAIHALVLELAAYERLTDAVDSTPAMLAEALFGPAPRVFCDLACAGQVAAGLALWFYDFSTFRGRHGIYLEDLFVRPAFRGHGLGKRLVARLAARCVAENLPRMTWSVLDWNTPAIDFYRAQGAVLLDEWTACRLDGEALAHLAGKGSVACVTTAPSLALIAAVARNGVIGAGDALPWQLPGDLRHFKATTMGKPVLMGRKTYATIGRPLPGRTVIVVSRDETFAPEGVLVSHSLPGALAMGAEVAVRCGVDEVMVAGGGELYAALMARAERLYITDVDANPPGDTMFPAIDATLWRERSRQAAAPMAGDQWPYSLVTYERR